MFLFFLMVVIFLQVQLYTLQTQLKEFKCQLEDRRFVPAVEDIVHHYLTANPNVLLEVEKKLQQQEDQKKKKQIEKKVKEYQGQLFDLKAPGRLELEPARDDTTTVTMVLFTQPQCSHCKIIDQLLIDRLKNDSRIKLITIYWPFLGADAVYAAKAIIAAQKQNQGTTLNQKFFEHKAPLTKKQIDTIINTVSNLNIKKLKEDMDSKETTAIIKQNFELAKNLGISGTPTIILTNYNRSKFSLILGLSENIGKKLDQALKEVL